MMRRHCCLGALLALAAAASTVGPVSAADAAADMLVPPGASPVDTGLFVADGLLDTKGPSSREALLQRFIETMGFTGEKRYGSLSVPASLWRRVLSLVGAQGDDALPAEADEAKIPIKVASGHYGMHRDADPHKRIIDGRVSVLYLEGDGHMTFTNLATHEKHTIDVKPGRLISWDNTDYYHSLEPAPLAYPRRMIGPMSFQPKVGQFETAGYLVMLDCPAMAGYVCSDTPVATPVDNYNGDPNPAYKCVTNCFNLDQTYTVTQFNAALGAQGTCYCYAGTGNPSCPGGFVPASGWVTSVSGDNPTSADCPTLPPVGPSTPFTIQATVPSRPIVSGGCAMLNVRMTRQPAGSPGARALLSNTKNQTTQYSAVATKKKPGNSTTYSLRATLPAGWTLKRARAHPAYKPTTAWKTPQVTTGQGGATVLLWNNVPLPQYGAGGRAFTRSFRMSCCSPTGAAAGPYSILVEGFQKDNGIEFNNQQVTLTANVRAKAK